MQRVHNPYVVDTSSLLKTEGGWNWLPWKKKTVPPETPPAPPEAQAQPKPPAPPPAPSFETIVDEAKRETWALAFLQEQNKVAHFQCRLIDWGLEIAVFQKNPNKIEKLQKARSF